MFPTSEYNRQETEERVALNETAPTSNWAYIHRLVSLTDETLRIWQCFTPRRNFVKRETSVGGEYYAISTTVQNTCHRRRGRGRKKPKRKPVIRTSGQAWNDDETRTVANRVANVRLIAKPKRKKIDVAWRGVPIRWNCRCNYVRM